MASERMRYIRHRMSEMNAVRTDIEMTPLKQEVEAVFNPRNLGMDCSMIDDLLTPYARKVKAMLDQGDTSEAITMFLEILESLSYHFVKDEHFNYFDDMYCPDYTCNDMMRNIIEKAKDGTLSDKEKEQLSAGIKKIAKMEAYDDYGSPCCISLWEREKL